MDYIDAVLPALKGEQSAEEKADREDARNKMRAKFSQPGGLGSKFKNLYEKMLKSLALPKGAKDELGIQGDNGMPPLEEKEEVTKSEGGTLSEEDD